MWNPSLWSLGMTPLPSLPQDLQSESRGYIAFADTDDIEVRGKADRNVHKDDLSNTNGYR